MTFRSSLTPVYRRHLGYRNRVSKFSYVFLVVAIFGRILTLFTGSYGTFSFGPRL